MTGFFVLEPDGGMFGTKWAYADLVEPSNSGPSQKCPVCGGAVSMLKWLPPHRVRLSSSKATKWGDFVWGAGFPLLVSARFKSIYEAEHLSGIATFDPPVEIVGLGTKKARDYTLPLPVYHPIEVPWGAANQDDVASEVTYDHPEKITCRYCRAQAAGLKQSRVVIDASSWAGTDIFKPRGAPVPFVVSDRFREVVERYGLRNVMLVPAEKYGYDEHRPGLWYVND